MKNLTLKYILFALGGLLIASITFISMIVTSFFITLSQNLILGLSAFIGFNFVLSFIGLGELYLEYSKS